MDYVKLLGTIIFGIGIVIEIFNTKWKWPFWKQKLEIKSKKADIASTVFIILGFVIIVVRIYLISKSGV